MKIQMPKELLLAPSFVWSVFIQKEVLVLVVGLLFVVVFASNMWLSRCSHF